jgi:hypothetical protein
MRQERSNPLIISKSNELGCSSLLICQQDWVEHMYGIYGFEGIMI